MRYIAEALRLRKATYNIRTPIAASSAPIIAASDHTFVPLCIGVVQGYRSITLPKTRLAGWSLTPLQVEIKRQARSFAYVISPIIHMASPYLKSGHGHLLNSCLTSSMPSRTTTGKVSKSAYLTRGHVNDGWELSIECDKSVHHSQVSVTCFTPSNESRTRGSTKHSQWYLRNARW